MKIKRVSALILLWIMVFFSSFSNSAEFETQLTNTTDIVIQDTAIWRKINTVPDSFPVSLETLKHLYQASTPIKTSLVNQSGTYVARLKLNNQAALPANWFVRINANFVDQGLGFWESEQYLNTAVINFSQHGDNNTPVLMHTQAFELPLSQQESGDLWLYINAEHFALPLSVDITNSASFYHKQFITNTVTLFSIATMLTLATIALILYVKTRLIVTLACSAYIGLHGLGWAAASGLIDDIFNIQTINTSYLGIVIFPFAIASASQFTKLLFNFDSLHKRLEKIFNGLSIVCLIIGFILPLLSFSIAFTISHIIALIWVPLAIVIGIKMLASNDFRAKYYLLGNLMYGLSMLYYILSHSDVLTGQRHAELIVMLALTGDCFCILLSLAAWLQQKKQDYSRTYYQARIDPLTHIGNRYALSEALAKVDDNYIITFIDYDGMKLVNDEIGHNQGDALLRYGAKTMTNALDSKGEVFRTGGDEFVWLLNAQLFSDMPSAVEDIGRMMMYCQSAMQSKWPHSGISYGIAHARESSNQSECLALADARMYQHKRSKNTPPLAENVNG
ncbi:diguanylate cyclase domain-containing protein [Shewanella sp. GutDb-MelDb]|uniref:sensor domain-containing diguanylate cyclase n=1 Tax=Shewanella sp. GutDb-MelDb TaxID=2058316 RepID=UPI000C7BBD61|nr:diguanylate cyclase [Shewanella sp. GutDb-MelDb]PKG56998.1 diguanylate cyclase [Shewanella sp. GutDb-MelDb]